MKILAALLIVFGLSFYSFAGAKERTWQTGTLTDVSMEKNSRTFGSFHEGHGTVGERRDDATYYEIDTAEYIYVAKRTLTRRGDKQIPLTVNDPVKFAIDGDDFILLDEQGKEHKLSLEKKTRKNTPTPN